MFSLSLFVCFLFVGFVSAVPFKETVGFNNYKNINGGSFIYDNTVTTEKKNDKTII